MKNALKFLLLVVLLNIIRYVLVTPIEGLLIFEWHDRVMQGADYFNFNFSKMDWVTSFFYNFMLWFTITLVFYLMHPVLKGHMVIKSFKVYGLMYLFFASLSAVYMNHYLDKEFHIVIIVDGLITFSVLGLANGLIFPKMFKQTTES